MVRGFGGPRGEDAEPPAGLRPLRRFSREGLLSCWHRENESHRQPLGEQRNQPPGQQEIANARGGRREAERDRREQQRDPRRAPPRMAPPEKERQRPAGDKPAP